MGTVGFCPNQFLQKGLFSKCYFLGKYHYMQQFYAKLCIEVGLPLFYDTIGFEITGPNQVYNRSVGPVSAIGALYFLKCITGAKTCFLLLIVLSSSA